MARGLALLALAVLLALGLCLWRESKAPEPVPGPEAPPPANSLEPELEALETSALPSRAEVQPLPVADVALLDTEPGETTKLCVRVVSAHSREPCPEAWVTLANLPEACGTDGRIELRLDEPCVLRAGAPGYLPTCATARAGHETPEKALAIELARASSIVVVLEDAPLTGYPALSVAREPGSGCYGPAGQGYFDAAGRALVDELPPDVPLLVRVSDGSTQLVEVPEPITLRAGETRMLRLRLRDACRLDGRALDERGVPVAGLALWLLPAASPPRMLVEPLERGQASASAVTDERGRFVFERVLPGRWRIAPAVSSRSLDLFLARDEIAPVALQVEVPPGVREQAVVYRVQAGYFIEGVALDPEVNPARGVLVSATTPGVEAVRTGQDGRFAIGPLPAGSYELVGWARTPFASEAVRAEAGARDVVLRMPGFSRTTGRATRDQD